MFREYPYINLTDLNLDSIYKVVKAAHEEVEALTEWKNEHEIEYQALKEIMDRIDGGELTPALTESITTWLNNNMDSIVDSWVKMVFFGLTDSGYFVAYVPDGWSDVTFRTSDYDIDVPLMPDYGHLVLTY